MLSFIDFILALAGLFRKIILTRKKYSKAKAV